VIFFIYSHIFSLATRSYPLGSAIILRKYHINLVELFFTFSCYRIFLLMTVWPLQEMRRRTFLWV